MSRGKALAERGRESFKRAHYKDAMEDLLAATEQLIADGELIEVAGTLRSLIEVQLASRQFADALETVDMALQFALPDDVGWIMMDRAKVYDAAASPQAAAAWREAAARLPSSTTTLACLAHAAGSEIRHRNREGFAAARELAAQWQQPIHHITIAGAAGVSAAEIGLPLLAQAMRIMVWDRRCLAGEFLQPMIRHIAATKPAQLLAFACIGDMNSYVGFPLAVLPEELMIVMTAPDLTRLKGYPALLQARRELAMARGGDVPITSVPFDHWLLDSHELNAHAVDHALRAMIPDSWVVVG